jgi:hypothetical protein
MGDVTWDDGTFLYELISNELKAICTTKFAMTSRSPRSISESTGLDSSVQSTMHNMEVEVNYEELTRQRPRVLHQRAGLPPRTTIWVLCMFSLGTTLILLGLGQYYDSWFGKEGKDGSIGLSMIGLGSMMFIPGSYATYILYGAWNRWDGFTYNLIPDYGDNSR